MVYKLKLINIHPNFKNILPIFFFKCKVGCVSCFSEFKQKTEFNRQSLINVATTLLQSLE